MLGVLITINERSTNLRIELNRRGPMRLQILSVATGRVFRPSILDTRSWLIALDGFNCPLFELSNSLFLNSSQRSDILVEPPQSGDGFFSMGTVLRFTGVRDRAMVTKKYYLAQHTAYGLS